MLTASSAEDALEIVGRQSIDVLIADIAMPVEDGYALIRRIRALEPPGAWPMPAVALTAYARDEDRRLALQAGFQTHLSKPIASSSLIDSVAHLHASRPRSLKRRNTR